MAMIMTLSTLMMRKGVMPVTRIRAMRRPSYPPNEMGMGTFRLNRNAST